MGQALPSVGVKKTPARRLKRLVIGVGVSIAMLLGVRSTVAEIYSVDSACIEPELPRHSRVLVFKLASDFKPGQILAYRPDRDHVYLGRVEATDHASRQVTISRNGAAPSPVPFEKVIGRVILNSR